MSALLVDHCGTLRGVRSDTRNPSNSKVPPGDGRALAWRTNAKQAARRGLDDDGRESRRLPTPRPAKQASATGMQHPLCSRSLGSRTQRALKGDDKLDSEENGNGNDDA